MLYKPEENKWYPAWAVRCFCQAEHVILSLPCKSREEALEVGEKIRSGTLEESFDAFLYKDKRWWHWGYNLSMNMFELSDEGQVFLYKNKNCFESFKIYKEK